MWRSSLRATITSLLLAVASFACGSSDRPDCLPALFEDGQRLHDRHGPNLFDLDLIFRQHEVCKSSELEDSVTSVALVGNSAVFGLDVHAEESVAGLINQRWKSVNAQLRAYNLAFVTSYLLKDVLITRKAIEYEPDMVVYGISLSDFIHMAPIPWPDVLPRFFAANEPGLDRLQFEGAAGLGELVSMYRERDARASWPMQQLLDMREAGSFVRLSVRHTTPRFVDRWLLDPKDGSVAEAEAPVGSFPKRGLNYQCEKVLEQFASKFGDTWQTWNVFAYLEQLEREHGIEIAVFDLPIQHHPKGDCYNARYPARSVLEYRQWIRAESYQRGIALWDFHDLLPASQFQDTIHPTAEGNRMIAATLAKRIRAASLTTRRRDRSRE